MPPPNDGARATVSIQQSLASFEQGDGYFRLYAVQLKMALGASSRALAVLSDAARHALVNEKTPFQATVTAFRPTTLGIAPETYARHLSPDIDTSYILAVLPVREALKKEFRHQRRKLAVRVAYEKPASWKWLLLEGIVILAGLYGLGLCYNHRQDSLNRQIDGKIQSAVAASFQNGATPKAFIFHDTADSRPLVIVPYPRQDGLQGKVCADYDIFRYAPGVDGGEFLYLPPDYTKRTDTTCSTPAP